jgi:phage tail-like protein
MTTTVKPTQSAFIRLDSRIGWRLAGAQSENVIIDMAGTLMLGRAGVYPIPPNEPFGSFGGLTLVTGITIHPHGQVILADPAKNCLLYYIPPFGKKKRPVDAPDHWPFRQLWPVPPPPVHDNSHPPLPETRTDPYREPFRLNRPRDVAFCPAGDLVVADSGNGRLLFFTWPALRVRHILAIPDGAPDAIAFDARGRLYAADSAHGRVHRFDHLWRPDTAYIGGAGDLQQPGHVAVDLDDNVFVLDKATQTIAMLDRFGNVAKNRSGAWLSVDQMALFRRVFPPPLQLKNGNIEYPQPLPPVCGVLQLPGIVVDARGHLAGTRLTLLARPQRLNLPRHGIYRTEALDSGMDGCRWHRLVFDVDLVSKTRLIVRTTTFDSALPDSRINELSDEYWSGALPLSHTDLPEILVQSPPGRYMWLKIELTGDGRQSPLLGAVEVHAPRRSSLQWLPPVYRSDPDSADFLDRLLSLFDTRFAEIQYEIEHFARRLDPYSVPTGEFLDWLGSWFDWHFLAEWPESTRREMIAEAITFFKQRGTINGMRRMLQWHTGLSGQQPQILEHFRLHDYGERHPARGDLVNGLLYIGGRPLIPSVENAAHRFTIVIPASVVPDKTALLTLNRLIEAQKPAHTGFELRIVKPGVRVGCQATVGVDMWLSDYPLAPLGTMKLGQSSRTVDDRQRGFRLGSPSSPSISEKEGY